MREGLQRLGKKPLRLLWNAAQGVSHPKMQRKVAIVARGTPALLLSYGALLLLAQNNRSVKTDEVATENEDPVKSATSNKVHHVHEYRHTIVLSEWILPFVIAGPLGVATWEIWKDIKKNKTIAKLQADLKKRYQAFTFRRTLTETSPTLSFEKNYQPLKLREKKSKLESSDVDEKDLFQSKKTDGLPSGRLLITGNAGSGKSTFCQNVARKWAEGTLWEKENFALVLHIPLPALQERALTLQKKGETLTDLDAWYVAFGLSESDCNYATKKEEIKILKESLEIENKKILYLLDDYGSVSRSAEVQKLLKEVLYNNPFVILTCRFAAVPDFVRDREIHLEGFDELAKGRFIQDYFTEMGSKELAEDFLALLKKTPALEALSSTPLLLEIFCLLYLQQNRRAFSEIDFSKQTEIYTKVIVELMRRCLIRKNPADAERIKNLSDEEILEKTKLLMDALGSMAYQAVEKNTAIYKEWIPREDALGDFELGDLLVGTGLLRSNSFEVGLRCDYTCIHPSLLEFLAAWHMRSKLEEKSAEILAGKPPQEILREMFGADYLMRMHVRKDLTSSFFFGLWSRSKKPEVKSALKPVLQEYPSISDPDVFVPLFDELEKGYLEKITVADFFKYSLTEAERKQMLEGALLLSSVLESKECFVWLHQQGAKLEVKDKSGFTPLHWAVLHDRKEVVDYFLDQGANIDVTDGYGYTPLHHAILRSRPKMVKYLLSKNAQINTKDVNGRASLWSATVCDQTEIVKCLVAAGADLEAKNDLGETLVNELALSGKTEMVRCLLSLGADIETKDNHGWTPLRSALVAGQIDMMKMLLTEGANVDAKDNNGWTLLCHAASEGNSEAVRLLLVQGADVTLKIEDDVTVLDHALELIDFYISLSTDENSEWDERMRKEKLHLFYPLQQALEAYQRSSRIEDFDAAFKAAKAEIVSGSVVDSRVSPKAG